MKALAINGSPRTAGNTFAMMNTVLDVLKEGGVEREIYQAGGKPVMGCKACGVCRKTNAQKCVTDDWINELYPKVLAADAIIIGSPTYFADLTPETKAVIDRCGYIARSTNAFSRKIGAAVSAVRRAGGIYTLDSIQHFFFINDMIVPGSSYWNMSLSRDIGDFDNDKEGIATMQRLGENILWLLTKLSHTP